jgi:hypothetical protein
MNEYLLWFCLDSFYCWVGRFGLWGTAASPLVLFVARWIGFIVLEGRFGARGTPFGSMEVCRRRWKTKGSVIGRMRADREKSTIPSTLHSTHSVRGFFCH